MHSYRRDYSDNEAWVVFFDDGAESSSPRDLKTFANEIHAMDLVNYLNGGSMSARLSYVLERELNNA